MDHAEQTPHMAALERMLTGETSPEKQWDGEHERSVVDHVVARHEDISGALSALMLSVQFLAEQADGAGKEAAADATLAIRRIDRALRGIWERCLHDLP